MHWDNSDRDSQLDSRQPSQLHTAIGVSLVLHGVLLVLILLLAEQRTQNRQTMTPATVRINLLPLPEAPEQTLPSEPGPVEEVVQPVEGQEPLSEVAEIAAPEPVESPAEQAPLPEQPVELPQLVEIPIIPSEGETISEPVRIPDTLMLRQTVRHVRELHDVDSVLSSCTPAQRHNELFDCPDPVDLDYTNALRNPIYFSFNQSQTDVQSRRAMGTIAGNQQQLRSGIRSYNLDGVDNDYLLEELSQGIEVYSGTGNTRLERLTDQIYSNDPVYQQAKRIMNPR